MAASTVTGNTSVVLVSSPQSKVYLSSVGYPGHIVTIKDLTGVASQGDPIVVSTTNGVFFADGSISTLLVDPFSYLTVSSKTPTTWQILNNIGYFTTLSNAFVNTLTAGNAYTNVVSTVEETVSSATIQTVNVTQSLELLGNVDILGNITVNGVVDLFSTLSVKEDIRFSSFVYVQGAVSLQSTLSIKDELIVGGNMSTLTNLTVGESLFIGSSLYVQSALVPKFLSVQTLTMNTMNLGGGLQTAQGVSVGCNTFLGGSLTSLSSLLLMSSLNIQGNTRILSSLSVDNRFQTNVLEGKSSVSVTKEVAAGSLTVSGIVSTPNSLFLKGFLTAASTTNVESVLVSGEVETNSLIVNGNAVISSMLLLGNMEIGGNMSLTNNLFTSTLQAGITGIGNALSVYQSTNIEQTLSTFGDFSHIGPLTVEGMLLAKQNTLVRNLVASTLTVAGLTSTNVLDVNGDLVVSKDFSIQGTALVNALAAPINISLSTLSLSNTFTANTSANIPITTAFSTLLGNPLTNWIAGEDNGFLGFLAGNTVNIRSTLQYFSYFNQFGQILPPQQSISTTRISTLVGTNLLSTFLIGSSNFKAPVIDASGLFLLGSNVNGSNAYKITTANFQLLNDSLKFSTIAYGANYSQNTGVWVAVGQNSTSKGTIQYSTDRARTWNPITSGGFSTTGSGGTIPAAEGRDVLYTSTLVFNQYPRVWVATGKGTPGSAFDDTIQYSSNGSNWLRANIASAFGSYSGKRVFLQRFVSNPSEGAVVLVGGNAGPASFGIFYSADGSNYYQSSGTPPGFQFDCEDITAIATGRLYAVGTVSGTKSLIRADEEGYNEWTNITGTALNPAINFAMASFKTIAYGQNKLLIGGVPLAPSGTTSIFWAPVLSGALGSFQAISMGGFTNGCERIVFNEEINAFLAVGSNTGGANFQISPDGINWISALPNTFPSRLYNATLAGGGIESFDTISKYFTVNVPARLESGISSISLTGDYVTASSFTASSFTGDARLMSNLTNFQSSINVSSILTKNIFIYDQIAVFGNTLQFSTANVQSTNLIATDFFSSGAIAIAGGVDSLPTGNIQTTSNIINWTRATGANFEYSCRAITGNNNSVDPFYVATGGDSDPARTIQYSRNGNTWTPVETGGFPVQVDGGGNTTGVAEGLTAIQSIWYSTISGNQVPFGPRYFVGGLGTGPNDSLLYSDDGSNFSTTANIYGVGVKTLKAFGGNIYALNYSPGYFIHSINGGVDWILNTNNYTFDAFGIGAFDGLASQSLYGLRFDPMTLQESLYSSGDFGLNWTFINTFGSFTPIDMVYSRDPFLSDGYWLILTANSVIRASTVNAGQWVSQNIGSEFSQVTRFDSLYRALNSQKWYLGAQSQNPLKTIWTSEDGMSWSPITSGGFSSATVSIGAGYGIAMNSTFIMAVGSGAFTSLTSAKAQILDATAGLAFGTPYIYTNPLLTQQNASNVFATAAYGISIPSTLVSYTYPYIAVGDGAIPQKTIARSSNRVDWIPAVTGGFSPAGYAVKEIYFPSLSTLLIATGKAAASTATIQYSEDGANWFATNNSGSIPNGGRGIAQISSLSRTVIVGEGVVITDGSSRKRTTAYSDDGYNWTEGDSGSFNGAGYGVAEGWIGAIADTGLIAVGRPLADDGSSSQEYSFRFTRDGNSWSRFGSVGTGFDIAGYGIAFGRRADNGDLIWVAVGENRDYRNNIQYSLDGETWNPANYPAGFFYAGYAVNFNRDKNLFVAVGKSLSNTESILVSDNGVSWNVAGTSNSGFKNQERFGTAYGFYSQDILRLERAPFFQFPKLTIYERSEPFNYNTPSLRIQSTLVTFNEALSVNISSQIMINTYTPFEDYTVTVEGDIQTSSLIYKGNDISSRNLSVYGTITVSTLQASSITGNFLSTPSWANQSGQANILETKNDSFLDSLNNPFTTGLLGVNETLYIMNPVQDNFGIGVGEYNTLFQYNKLPPFVYAPYLQVEGTTATSSLTTGVLDVPSLEISEPNQVFYNASNLAMFAGINPGSISNRNTIYSAPSTLTFNNIFTLNTSTQRVGIFTSNPLFDFHVQTVGVFSTLRTPIVNTRSLFFTLQSF